MCIIPKGVVFPPLCTFPAGAIFSHCKFNVFTGSGEPNLDLGLPPDVLLDREDRVFAKTILGWTQWEPDRHSHSPIRHPLMPIVRFYADDRYGLTWGSAQNEKVHRMRQNIPRIVAFTKSYLDANEEESKTT